MSRHVRPVATTPVATTPVATTPPPPKPAPAPVVPSIGRIVIYTEQSGVETAALIVAVLNATCVNLRTFPDDNESHFKTRSAVVEGPGPGCWKWPR